MRNHPHLSLGRLLPTPTGWYQTRGCGGWILPAVGLGLFLSHRPRLWPIRMAVRATEPCYWLILQRALPESRLLQGSSFWLGRLSEAG